MLQSGGYDAQWQPVLSEWITAILHAPLTTQGISLSQLSARDKQVEMEFYLPIASPLRAEALDALIREHDPLSAGCPPLNFRQVQGMLKGFIDLVFRHEGRYYLLDYKSNWLGETAKPIPNRRWPLPCRCIVTICSTSCIPGAASLSASSHCKLPLRRPFWRGDLPLPARGGCRRSAVWYFSTRPDAALIEKWTFAAGTEELA